jgi:hypothetical protein
MAAPAAPETLSATAPPNISCGPAEQLQKLKSTDGIPMSGTRTLILSSQIQSVRSMPVGIYSVWAKFLDLIDPNLFYTSELAVETDTRPKRASTMSLFVILTSNLKCIVHISFYRSNCY